MKKWVYGVESATFLMMAIGAIGGFMGYKKVAVLGLLLGMLILPTLIIFVICYKGKCRACGKWNCICEEPEKAPEKDEKC